MSTMNDDKNETRALGETGKACLDAHWVGVDGGLHAMQLPLLRLDSGKDDSDEIEGDDMVRRTLRLLD